MTDLSLEAIGKGYKNTPNQKISEKTIHARPSSAIQKPGTPHLTKPSPQIVQINKASMSNNEQDLQIIGKKVEDAVSTKELQQKTGVNIFASEIESSPANINIKENAQIQEKLLFSGGFKFLEQNIEKKQKKLTPFIIQKEQQDQNIEDLSKANIMQKLGVKKDDVNIYFDIMDDRVYDQPDQQEQIKELLINKAEERLENVLKLQDELNKKKVLLEKANEKKRLDRQEAQARLLSKKPQSYFKKIKEQQLADEEDANEQQEQQEPEIEEEEWKKQYKQKLMEAKSSQDENQQGDKEISTDDQNNPEQTKEQTNFSQKLDQFIQINPDLNTTEAVRSAHEEKLRELEYMYFKRKRDGDKVQNDKEEIQQKIKKGIMIKPMTQEEKEYKNFEEEFKNYVRDRRKNKQLNNISKKMEKKDFERYQATSPDKTRWVAQPQAHFQEIVSTLIPKGDALQTSSASNLMKNSQLGKSKLNQSFEHMRQSQVDQKSGVRSLSASKIASNTQLTMEELKLMQALFQKIDKDNAGQIEKLDLARALIINKDLKEFYCINENTINQDLSSFQNKKKGTTVMDLEEMALFLKQNKQKHQKKQKKQEDDEESQGNPFAKEIIKQRKIQKGAQQDKASLGACLLTKEQLSIIKSIFEEVDKHHDLVVARADLIEKLRNDVRVIKILHLPAVFLSAIGKQLNVEKLLYRIEKEQLIGNESERKSKEYITWNQFYEYFTDSKNMKEGTAVSQIAMDDKEDKIKMMKIYQQLADNLDDQNEIDLDKEGIELLRTEYDNLPKQGQVYVNSQEFIEAIKLNPKFNYLQRFLARRKANKFELLDEVFGDVLNRMEQEAEEFLDWDEIMDYFTRRGRSKFAQQIGKEKQNQYVSLTNPPKIKAGEDKFVQEQKNKQKQQQLYANEANFDDQVDAYDSDPETNTYGRGYTQKRVKRNKSVNNLSISRTELSKSRIEENYVNKNQIQQDNSQEEEEINLMQRSQYEDTNKKVRYKDEIDNEDYKGQSLSPTSNRIQSLSPKRHKERSPNQRASSDNEEKLFDNKRQLDNQKFDYKKVGEYMQRKEEKNIEKKHKLTKPEPYQFDEREKKMQLSTNLSIRKKKLQEMIEEKQKLDEDNLKQKFRAREVPAHVKQPLFEKKMKEQEERRAQVKANSVALTIQREKPFSFYKRDKMSKKKSHQEREEFVFKAKAVPWFCSLNMMEKINNEEQLKRQERVSKHAQYLMTISKLPPRMEMHEQLKRAQDINAGLFGGFGGAIGTTTSAGQGGYNYQQQQTKTSQGKIFMQTDNLTFQPIKANQIPDFQTLQKNFQDNLDKKRQNKRPTKPVPFNFQASRKAPPREYLDVENEMMKAMKEKPQVDKIAEARKLQVQKPVLMPPSTKKFEDYVEKLRKDKEKKQQEREQLLKQQQLIEEKQKQMKKRVMKSKLMQQDKTQRQQKEEEKKKQFQEDWKKKSEDYKLWKQKLNKKTKEEPLLIERPPMREKEIEKLKSINKILKIVEKNKIKDIKSLFTPEEYELVQDLQYLKKHGYSKYFDEENENEEEKKD